MESHVKISEDLGRVLTVLSGGESRTARDKESRCTRRGNAPSEHGLLCGCSTTGSPAAGPSPSRESSSCFITKRARRKRGAKHTTAVVSTTAADVGNDAGYAATIRCCATSDPPRLWRTQLRLIGWFGTCE